MLYSLPVVTYNPCNAGPVNISVIKIDQRTSSFLLAYGVTKHINRYRELSGLLTDNTGNPIAGQHVDVKFTRLSSGASKTYDIVTSYDGGFVMPINLALGIYAVNMTYHGTTIYGPSYRNVIVNVTDDPIYDADWFLAILYPSPIVPNVGPALPPIASMTNDA